MMESAAEGMKLPARENRTIRIRYVKAVETMLKSNQKHSAVSAASAMRPSKRCTVSCSNLLVGLRVIPIDRLLGPASRDSSHSIPREFWQSYRSSAHTGRSRETSALVKQRLALRWGCASVGKLAAV